MFLRSCYGFYAGGVERKGDRLDGTVYESCHLT